MPLQHVLLVIERFPEAWDCANERVYEDRGCDHRTAKELAYEYIDFGSRTADDYSNQPAELAYECSDLSDGTANELEYEYSDVSDGTANELAYEYSDCVDRTANDPVYECVQCNGGEMFSAAGGYTNSPSRRSSESLLSAVGRRSHCTRTQARSQSRR